MPAPAAFQATFHALRTVGGRKVCQVVLEVPIEHMAHVVNVLGSPNAESSTWVAVARLDPKGTSAEARPDETLDKPRPGGRKRFHELPYSQQAALSCADPVFRRFMDEQYDALDSEESVAEAVRDYCGVVSRAELRPGTRAGDCWEHLHGHFLAWKQVA